MRIMKLINGSAFIVLALSTSAAGQGTATAGEIVVAATGSATVTPDRATLVLEVRTEAATPQEAAARNGPIMDAVLEAVRRAGLSPRQVSTRGYTVQPHFRYEGGGAIPAGYAATNAVIVRFDSVSAVGRTLDAALGAGATRIGSLRFESSQYDSLHRAALQRAVATARLDAEALASAAGGTLGDLVSITTDPRTTFRELEIAAASMPPLRGETPINAGEQTISARIEARWQFVKR